MIIMLIAHLTLKDVVHNNCMAKTNGWYFDKYFLDQGEGVAFGSLTSSLAQSFHNMPYLSSCCFTAEATANANTNTNNGGYYYYSEDNAAAEEDEIWSY